MVNCQGGTSPVHQPVLAISAGGRNELINRPKVGIDHRSAMSTTRMVTELLLSARVKRSSGDRGRSIVSSLSETLFARSLVARSAICCGSIALIAVSPLLVNYEY